MLGDWQKDLEAAGGYLLCETNEAPPQTYEACSVAPVAGSCELW